MLVHNVREKKRISILGIEKAGEIDYVLFSIVIIFYGLGIVMVFSASINEGIKLDNSTYFLGKQIMWVIVSFVSCIIFMFMDLRILDRYKKTLVWGIVVLLIILLIPPLIKTGIVHPSRRWFRFGEVGFQPSEFAKAVLIFYLSSILTKKGGKLNDFYRGFLPPFLVVAAISFLVLLEPDFSTAFILFFISILMFFIMGIRSLSIISLLFVSIPAVFLMITGKGYRRERMMGFLNPWSDPTDKGYQIIQSFRAFAYGGFFGVGLGKSVQKMRYLPIPHTDFIFAIIAEEIGFFGVILVVTLYMLFAYRGLRIAYNQKNSYEFLLAFGITSLIVWEAVFNIAVVTGLLPSTGISLPFLSYGGSSLLVNSILAGILLNISKRESVPFEPMTDESVNDDKWISED